MNIVELLRKNINTDYYLSDEDQIILKDVGTSISVSPSSLVTTAKKIRKNGQEVNQLFIEIFQLVDNMHQDWQGESYQKVRRDFNTLVVSINKIDKFIVEEIPTTLEKVANRFSNADEKGDITKVGTDTAINVTMLLASKDSGLRFIPNKVDDTKNLLVEKFEQAKEEITKIIKLMMEIGWSDNSQVVFTKVFEIVTLNTTNSFNEVIQKLNRHIKEQITAMEKLESANMF